ncbi:g6736 [Coccomyxa viridis]|uniref:G6736 protein n=1 Tax=Coccomyxa viridis TaxID=1274662 RepID=A0ABP1FW31_9CHLO
MSISFNDMFTQLDEAWPLASYPFLAVLPTSEVIMMVGSLVALYTISPSTFSLAFSRNLPMRPDGIPWTYPQTGVATLLPLDPADNYAVKVLSAGGCSEDLAGLTTPATNAAYIFDLATVTWSATPTPMTQPRVIGNVILLPTSQVLIINGAGTGTSGFGTGIGGGNTLNPVLQPEIYDIATSSWSGPKAAASNPRLYHSTAILLPSGEVLVSGSEVTQDFTAEIYRPSYLSSPHQPFINMPTAPQSLAYGSTLQLSWGRTSTLPSEDVDHGVLIKSGAITHSTHFDQRMVILVTTSASPVTSQSVGGLNSRSGTIVVQMPPSNLIAPPGQYMLFLLGKDNTPSPAIYVSLGVPVPANAPQPPQDSGVGYNLLANTAYATGSDLFNFYCAGGQCLTVPMRRGL